MKKGVICYLALEERPEEIEYDLLELKELLRNIDIEIAHAIVQRRRPDPGYMLGRGKIDDLKEYAATEGIGAIVFNRELSPRQVECLEELFDGVDIWDRTQVILEIFDRRARSREGKIQAELARLTYLYPRIFGLGNVLSRLGGGIGTRGPGETKLEVLRRDLRQRIVQLKKEVNSLRAERELLRNKRRVKEIPIASLVGYTNAGKSSLLNALASSSRKVLARDQLFATLDPVSRRIYLPSGRMVLLTDTVGFIKELPRRLKEAFTATLEELAEADLLLHVIDLTSPCFEEQVKAVEKILKDLSLENKPVIKVYNKSDRYEGDPPVDGIVISALKETNFHELFASMEEVLFPEREYLLQVPFDRLGTVNLFREQLRVIKEVYLPEGVQMVVSGRHEDIQKLKGKLKTTDKEQGGA